MVAESSSLSALEALSLEDATPSDVPSVKGTSTADSANGSASEIVASKSASSRQSGGFPTEIIEMILQHVCLPAAPPFYRHSNCDMSSINGLLKASRNFYAVLSPLVYPLQFKHIVIERPSQLASLHHALTTKPWLRPLVKRIVIGREKESLYSSCHGLGWPVACDGSENFKLRDAAANDAQPLAIDPYSYHGVIGLLRSVLELTRGAHVRVTVLDLKSSIEKGWNRHLALVRKEDAETRTGYWLQYHLVDRDAKETYATDAQKKLNQVMEEMKINDGKRKKEKGRRGKSS